MKSNISAEVSADQDADIKQDDLGMLQVKIASQVAELSQEDILPSGYRGKPSSFDASEVSFDSGNWLIRVLQVQCWLRLDGEIDLSTGDNAAFDAAKQLFDQLLPAEAKDTLDGNASFCALSLFGAEALADRLDLAISLQARFTEWCESYSKKEATKNWIEAWEEELGATTSFAEQIRATSDTWVLSEFSYFAEQGSLNLNPTYQRGDVWPTSDAQKLIESIVRGIPLPSIILLKPTTKKKELQRYEVVDGKQRLTSILRFIGQHTEAMKRVKEASAKYPNAKLEELFEKDYRKFRKVWKRVVGETLTDAQETEYYFPFPMKSNSKALDGNLQEIAGKYYCEIRDNFIEVGEGTETVYQLFEKKSQYKVPIIQYTEATPRQIQEVFNLYNKQGKHLNAEEIRNALFHEADLVRLLLAAAGDNRNISVLAPYVPAQELPVFTVISEYLDGYRFGTARYKRTKMLSWLVALLFEPAEKNGELTIRSTAKQIDQLLTSVLSKPAHKLTDHAVLRRLLKDLDRCLAIHSGADCWHSLFKDDDNGTKWQELQLAASWVAVFLFAQSTQEAEALIDLKRDELIAFTKSCRRPENTQNKTQWGFIGEAALGILETLGADFALIEANLSQAYGASCITTLRAARVHHKSR